MVRQAMNAPTTILIVSSLVALAMAAVLFIVARTYPKTIRGVSEWALAALAIALSLPLFVGRGAIPDLFSIVGANLLVLAAFLMMNIGTRKFAGVRSEISPALLTLFILSYVVLFLLFTYVRPSIGTRIAVSGAFTLVVILDLFVLALRALPRTTGRRILVLSLAILIGARIVRLGSLALGFAPPTGVFDASLSQLAYIALPSIMIPLGTISLVMLASEKLREELEFSSRYDDLTHCLNKKSAMEELRRETARASRSDNKLAIMLVDLDNFKIINDTHGHLEGDKVLADFSRQAKTFLRETDWLARFGGDEFMVILPDTDIKQASRVAARFHEAGRAGRPVAWSVSIGISEWRDQDDSLDALLTRADQALYASKARGRNQTQCR